ncbi:hypothetical protein AMS68_005595 [Peltaster fructicola]|uniref:Molybdenum cofactor sulfurase n=1 Tax=Peltaster fructicola TaxID=286661 RepID=A0A6H0XZQ3_9PEZI|nr:hypothetical protein AMS68_005595 [Peltaster fructicola]
MTFQEMECLSPPKTQDAVAYDAYIEAMRRREYPMLKDTLYLDHAGTPLPSKRLLDAVHQDLLHNLYGNPHSAGTAADASSQRVTKARSQLLSFFNADPEVYDLVFTSNATAAIKLVGDALRDLDGGFSYGYHLASHTSLIGLRELARTSQCLRSEPELQEWNASKRDEGVALFAFPAQSNMNGIRLPLKWVDDCRQQGVYSLLDAAAYASTALLDLTVVVPDFTVVSLYKIFGFPDLGALIVKKSAAHLFERRRYFGGGTVDMVICEKGRHAQRAGALHQRLEDGTLPIHSIVALNSALSTFDDLFGSMDRISRHTLFLAHRLHFEMSKLRHHNSRAVCAIYSSLPGLADATRQGPTIAFNLLDQAGSYISTAEVEKLAAVKDIRLRTGSVCNPGGIAAALDLSSADVQSNFDAGYRCGGNNGLINGKPTGVVRISLGAISTTSDVDRLLGFLQEFFVQSADIEPTTAVPLGTKQLQIESLTIYPVKSCAGWSIPYDKIWQVHQEGLAWDREWCIVRRDTGQALSQKQHPRMALIRPEIDLASAQLHIKLPGVNHKISVSLSAGTADVVPSTFRTCSTDVCGDVVEAQRYSSQSITTTLSQYLGIDCTLARFPAVGPEQRSLRHSKEHLNPLTTAQVLPLRLSNESPILTITRSSLDALNESLKARGKRAAHHSLFRANVILAEMPSQPPGSGRPWEEDRWQALHLQHAEDPVRSTLTALGGCRRCQMICVDQQTGEKRPEVFLTLAKQRRIDGKVLFGIHCAMTDSKSCSIQVGDKLEVTYQM